MLGKNSEQRLKEKLMGENFTNNGIKRLKNVLYVQEVVYIVSYYIKWVNTQYLFCVLTLRSTRRGENYGK